MFGSMMGINDKKFNTDIIKYDVFTKQFQHLELWKYIDKIVNKQNMTIVNILENIFISLFEAIIDICDTQELFQKNV
jgi:hypothetical protein